MAIECKWNASGFDPRNLKKFRETHPTGKNLVVAVNVSPLQFRQAGFVDTVANALATSGLAARFLELELTERTVMNDAELNLGTLSALNGMGVELALDDFGTGYSSLAYLKRFPVGKLKIERAAVAERGPAHHAIMVADLVDRVKNITGVLSALPGVAAAEVSLEAAEARVSFDPQVVSRGALIGAIQDAGFDAE